MRVSGIAIAQLATDLDEQFAAYWRDWQSRQYGVKACVVEFDWDYPQTLMLQQVSVNFLAKYQRGQGFIPNLYPEHRARVEQEVVEEAEIDPNALLAIAHSEDIELWQSIVDKVMNRIDNNEIVSFSQICQKARTLDWGKKDCYSKAKVYLGLLLSNNYRFKTNEGDFYSDFIIEENLD